MDQRLEFSLQVHVTGLLIVGILYRCLSSRKVYTAAQLGEGHEEEEDKYDRESAKDLGHGRKQSKDAV